MAPDSSGQAAANPAVVPMLPPPAVTLPSDPGQAAIENLRAASAHPGDADKLRTFGQFVGVWDMDIKLFDAANRTIYHQPAVWMFSWILDGRAIQDVLVSPRRPTALGKDRGMGTTIRYFDSETGRWRITYMAPTSRTYVQLEGTQESNAIVLMGHDMDGSLMRWMFTDVTATTFWWRGYTSSDNGKSWRMEQEMFGKKRLQ